MPKVKTAIILLISSLFILTSCSNRVTVNSNKVDTLRKELISKLSTIKKVNVSFMRPSVTIFIDMSEEPSQETLDAILKK